LRPENRVVHLRSILHETDPRMPAELGKHMTASISPTEAGEFSVAFHPLMPPAFCQLNQRCHHR